MREVDEHINSEVLAVYLNVVRILIFLLAVNHFIACAWYLIGKTNLENGVDSDEMSTISLKGHQGNSRKPKRNEFQIEWLILIKGNT